VQRKKRGSPFLNKSGRWEIEGSHCGERFHRVLPKDKRKKDAITWEKKIREEIFTRRVLGQQKSEPRPLVNAILKHLEEYEGKFKPMNHAKPLMPYCKGRDIAEVLAVVARVKTISVLSNATKNRWLSLLRRVTKLAYVNWGWIKEPLHAKISLLQESPSKPARAFTRNEVATLLRKIRGSRSHKSREVARAVYAALYTGLRSGELLALEPKDFTGDCVMLWDTKNGTNRAVPVVPFAKWAFRRLPFEINNSTLSHTVNRHVNGRFHWLRHTFGSWLLSAGEPVEVVSKMLGHSSASITSRVYSHIPTTVMHESAHRGLSVMKKRKETPLKAHDISDSEKQRAA
jgi:integrase